MATEESSEASDSSARRYPTGPITSAGEEELRRVLRSRLEHDVDSPGRRPSLTLLGWSAGCLDVIGHGLDRPEDAVLGFVLPARYSALAVLASSVVATHPRRVHQQAALALGVTREGGVISMLTRDCEVIETAEPQGWLIDACLRAVDRPTAPNNIAALAFPVALWLDRLMVQLVNSPATEPLRWSDAVDLCPIPRRWHSPDPVDLGTTLGSTALSWRALRNATIDGSRSPTGLTPERARWMDDAMFARWCMGSFPDLASLRGDVEFLAPSEVAEQVERTLRAAWLTFGA